MKLENHVRNFFPGSIGFKYKYELILPKIVIIVLFLNTTIINVDFV